MTLKQAQVPSVIEVRLDQLLEKRLHQCQIPTTQRMCSVLHDNSIELLCRNTRCLRIARTNPRTGSCGDGCLLGVVGGRVRVRLQPVRVVRGRVVVRRGMQPASAAADIGCADELTVRCRGCLELSASRIWQGAVCLACATSANRVSIQHDWDFATGTQIP